MDRKRGGEEEERRERKSKESKGGWEEREISSRSLRFNLPKTAIFQEVNVFKGWAWWTLLRTVTTEVTQKHEQRVPESFL